MTINSNLWKEFSGVKNPNEEIVRMFSLCAETHPSPKFQKHILIYAQKVLYVII